MLGMRELNCDLFSLISTFDAICITTNSVVNKNGLAVMGAGCALECAKRWPSTPKALGYFLNISKKNIPFQLGMVIDNIYTDKVVLEEKEKYPCRIFSFPTKHHYKDASNIDLIKESCLHMVKYANELDMEFIAIPRPGAGLGKLSYKDTVFPIISSILDNRFSIVCNEQP